MVRLDISEIALLALVTLYPTRVYILQNLCLLQELNTSNQNVIDAGVRAKCTFFQR